MKEEAPVIRIVRKKQAQEAHHGGSWKVAYADFVTAMMAFFLVMWIISMDQPLKEEIQSYFSNPSSPPSTKAGITKLASGGSNPTANGIAGMMNTKHWGQLVMDAQEKKFRQVQKNLQQGIASQPDLSRLGKHVDINVDRAGLRIELIEAEDSLFFESGSARPPAATRKLLAMVARELSRLANPIVIEGHTDSVPYRGVAAYSNWELSTDRANAARRVMQASGVRPDQVVAVRGYADRKLRDPQHPTHSTNRRVAILVQFSGGAAPDPDGNDTQKEAAKVKLPFSLDIRPDVLPKAESTTSAH
jgi:chemotaxis protein MotB